VAQILIDGYNEESSGSADGENSSFDSKRILELLKDGIDALPSGFVIFDAEDQPVMMNRVFREMLPGGAAMLEAGASFTEMARRNAALDFGLEGEALDDWMMRRLAYRDSPKGSFDQQLTDGRWYRIQESRTSEGGTVTNWTDITDLKLQEQVAESYSDALMTTNKQLEEFAHAASHDLQEPLRKIEVFGGRLSDKCGDQLDSGGARYLDRILDATSRMRRLVEDLLSFSKISDQKATFEKLDLNEVLNDSLAALDLRIDELKARICVDELPSIEGDHSQLTRLFQNLVSNAIKYIAPGSIPEVEITVTALDKKQVTIAVRDNGIGFDQQNAEKIFEAFQRLHGRSGDYSGSGIGLASCRKIVHQHDGSIRAESEPDKGSTFFVTLPFQHMPLVEPLVRA